MERARLTAASAHYTIGGIGSRNPETWSGTDHIKSYQVRCGDSPSDGELPTAIIVTGIRIPSLFGVGRLIRLSTTDQPKLNNTFCQRVCVLGNQPKKTVTAIAKNACYHC